MNIEIIYENEHVVVLNKPAGLVIHPDGRTEERTLVDWVLGRYPQIRDVGEPLILSSGKVIVRSGIVHRIDRETSGVLVVAKNQESFLSLKKQFQERTVQKEYRAFVYGRLKDERGIIERRIGKSSSNFRLWSAQRGARGNMREAITKYCVLSSTQEFSYVSVIPKTGRTHQIRVHFKAIHHPVVCDKLYAPKRPCELGFTRLALHSFALTLDAPGVGVKRFVADLPEDFIEAQNRLDSLREQ